MILVERGGEQGVIEAEEQQMIGAVLELGEQRVHEVMVPRIDIMALPVTASLDEIVDTIVERGPLAHPGLRGDRSTTSSASCTPRTCCPTSRAATSRPTFARIARPPLFVPDR